MAEKKVIRRYPEETKAKALALLSQGSTMKAVAGELGVSEQSLTNWKRAAGMTKGRKPKKEAKQLAKKDSQPTTPTTTQEKKSAGLGDLFQEYLAKEEELAALKKAIAERL